MMLLSRLAFCSDVFPLYIRLLDFKLDETGLESALQNYLQRFYPYLPALPWSEEARDVFAHKTIVLVFDGLDELSKALGPRGQSQSKAFVTSLLKFIDDHNPGAFQRSTIIKVIVLGRTVAIEELRHGRTERWDPSEVILLGLDKGKNTNMSFARGVDVLDPADLLENELRHEWWRKYAELVGEPHVFPKILDQVGIVELSREPLTLFLLVEAKYHLRSVESLKEGAAIAQIYRDILKGLYDRDMDRRAHAGQIQMSFEEFFRALQVIGFAAWFSTERSTTRKQLIAVLDGMLTQDRPIFEQFERNIDEGAMKLLLAAHMHLKKEGEAGAEDAAYEFSHKSFGEFLAAECLWRQICNISAPFIRRDLNLSITAQRVVDLLWNARISSDFSRFLHSIATLCGNSCSALPAREAGTSHDEHLLCLHNQFLIYLLRKGFVEGFSLTNSSQASFAEASRKHTSTLSILWELRAAMVGALSSANQAILRTDIDEFNRMGHVSLTDVIGPQMSTVSCIKSADFGFDTRQAFKCDFVGFTYAYMQHAYFEECKFAHTMTGIVSFTDASFRNCDFTNLTFSSAHFRQGPERRANERFRRVRDAVSSDPGVIAKVTFVNCRFKKVQWQGQLLFDVWFEDCEFEDVVFSQCVFFSGTIGLSGQGIGLAQCVEVDDKLGERKISGPAKFHGVRSRHMMYRDPLLK